MTLTDKLIPYEVWFEYGFGKISLLIGIINFGMLFITMITVKGIYIPAWMIIIFTLIIIALCIIIGYFFEKYAIWNRITSHLNLRVNPEVKQMLQDTQDIKKELAEMKKILNNKS